MRYLRRLFSWTSSIQMNPAANSIRQVLGDIRAALLPQSSEVDGPHPWKDYLEDSYEHIRPYLRRKK